LWSEVDIIAIVGDSTGGVEGMDAGFVIASEDVLGREGDAGLLVVAGKEERW
jgi:hypothetical protein